MAFLSDIFGRVGRVARGQANAGVDAMEDATFEATVNQTVADMKTELNNVVRASAMAMSNYNRLEAEYQKYVRQSQEWKDRAGMALDAGNEDLAKKALAKKAECDQQVNSMQVSVDNAQATSEKLKQQVGELKRKIDEGERTATTLVARKNAAVAQRKVSEAMAGVGNADNAFAAVEPLRADRVQGRSHRQGLRPVGHRRHGQRSRKGIRPARHSRRRGFRTGSAEGRAPEGQPAAAPLHSQGNRRTGQRADHRHQGRREGWSLTQAGAHPGCEHDHVYPRCHSGNAFGDCSNEPV